MSIVQCRIVSQSAQRYTASEDNPENHVYHSFRSGQVLDPSQFMSVSLGPHTYTQVPSRYASITSSISIYAHLTHSDKSSEEHLGLSSDTRFGVLRKTPVGTSEQHIRQKKDHEKQEVRKRDQLEKKHQQQVRQEGQGAQVQRRHQHQTRRGRRGLRNNDLQQQEVSGNRSVQMSESLVNSNQGVQVSGGHSSETGEPITGNHSADMNDTKLLSFMQTNLDEGQQQGFEPSTIGKSSSSPTVNYQEADNDQVRQHHGQHHPEHRVQAQSIQSDRPNDLLAHFREYNIDTRFPMISPAIPPLPPLDYEGVPLDQYPQHLADHILNHVYQADRAGQSSEHIYPQSTGRQREDGYVRPVHRETQEQFHQANYSQRVSHGTQVRVESYRQRHHPTAQRANREVAAFLDEMNQQPPYPETQCLRGDMFNGEPALSLHPPTPTVLRELAERCSIQPRAIVNNQILSVGSHPGPVQGDRFQSVLITQPTFDTNRSRSSNSNHSDSGHRGRSIGSSARSFAVDALRSNTPSDIGCGPLLQPRPLNRSNILGNSGIYSREPSPMPQRESSRFFESRHSSPGGARRRLLELERTDRSASTGRMG